MTGKTQDKIAALRQAVQHERDFMKIWDVFIELSSVPSFMKNSHPCNQNRQLETLLSSMFGEVGVSQSRLNSLVILRYGDSHLYHGPFFLGPSLAGFLYFQDINTGLAVMDSVNSKGVDMLRFAATPVPRDSFTPYPQQSSGMPTLH